jgi:aerobic-type carbon monoxide dehydrogenase small subunit (CoxS/CutS family)
MSQVLVSTANQTQRFDLTVNGQRRTVETYPDMPLLWVLREDLEMTGTKYGCGEGQCGACTVLLNNVPVKSCQTLVSAVGRANIVTIEGLAQDEKLTPVQEAFLEKDAMQCAYCTSGMIMASTALLRTNPRPTEAQVAQSLQGNICRCGTHQRIVAAVMRAAEMARGGA